MSLKPSPRGNVGSSPSARARLLLTATALIGAIAIGLWWSGAADEPEVDLGSDDVQASTSTVADGSATTTDEPVREVDAGAAAFAKDGTVGTTEASATEKRTRHHVLVRVIDSATKAPVPEAEVAADPFDEDTWRTGRLSTEARFERNLREGENAVTDADGRAWIRLQQGAQVGAAKGNLYGVRRFEYNELTPDGFELRLAPLESLVVRVRGLDGAPRAGVPIGFVLRYGGGEISKQVDDHPVGDTRADGSIEVRFADHVRPGLQPESIEVFVRAPGLTAVRADVQRGQREVELRLPAHGSVRVRALRANREPFPDQPTWTASLEQDSSSSNDDYYASLRTPGKGGDVLFPYVGLGRQLEASYRCDVNSESVALAGPVAAGQEVVHTFTIDDSETYFVCGRVLAADGTPIPRARAVCVVDPQTMCDGRVDKEGRFSISFRLPEGQKNCTMRLVVSVEGTGVTGFPPVALETGSTHDYGDLTIAPSEPIATGVVVADGPIGPAVWLYVQVPEEGGWGRSEQFAVDLHDDGTFGVHRLSDSGPVPQRMQLVARANGYMPVDPVEFRPGDDLRVELKRGPRFRARLLLDPAIDWFVARSGLDLLLKAQDGSSNYLHSRFVDGEWVFESSAVTPGIYEIALESGSAVDDLAQLEAVRIFSDEEPDPRLLPWDLRGTVQMLTVRLCKEDGSRLAAYGSVYRRRALDGEWESCGGFDDGVSQSISTAVPSDLCLEIGEYGVFRRTGVLGTIDVVVPTPKKVEVAFAGMPKLTKGTTLFVGVEVAEGWAKANGFPDDVSALVGYDWDAERQRLVVTTSQSLPLKVEVYRQVGEDSPLLGSLQVTVPVDQKEIEVPCPPEIVTALLPFAEAQGGGGR